MFNRADGSAETVIVERRITARARTNLSGRAVGWSKASEEMCFVTNLSAQGACVEFPASVRIPKRFDLLLGETASAKPVETVWQQANVAGVRFCTDRSNAPDILDDVTE